MPKPAPKKKEQLRFPLRSEELPASQRMLKLVRDELRAETRAGFKKVDARFNEVDAQFKRVDARFNEIDARFGEVNARFDRLEGQILNMTAEIARRGVLMEEQRSENRITLEAIRSFIDGKKQQDHRIESLERDFRSLARPQVP